MKRRSRPRGRLVPATSGKFQEPRCVEKGEGEDVLLWGADASDGDASRHGSATIANAGGAGQAVARRTTRLGMARGSLAVDVGVGLRREIALVHALRTVSAGSAAILVDALGLSLAAADTGAASPEGRC